MKTKLSQWGLCLLLLVMAAACSGDAKMTGLLEKVPANADFVAVGNLKTVIESAGGSVEEGKIKLPAYVADKMKEATETEEYKDFEAFLKKSGADIDACAITINFYEKLPTVIFALNDEEKFVNAIKGEDFKMKEVKDGVTFYAKATYESEYYTRYCYLAIKDGYVYCHPEVNKERENQTVRAIERLIEEADDASFAGTSFSDYITSGNAAGIAVRVPGELKSTMRDAGIPGDMPDLYEGVVCFKGDLTENAATFSMKWFDEEGNEKDLGALSKFMDMSAKINTDALAYMGADEFIVYAAGLKDVNWDNYIDMMSEAARMSRSDKAMLTIVKSYLEKIDGTVAVGFGLKNGVASISQLEQGEGVAKEASLTIVCEVKSGKATGLISDLKRVLDQYNVDYNDKSGGLSFTLPGGNGSIYLEAKDDILVLSNNKIKDDNNNPVVENVSFGNYIAAAGVYLSKDNPLMKDLKVKNDVKVAFTIDGQTLETTMTLEMDGDNSTGIIGKFVKAIISATEQIEKIMEERYAASNDDYYDDGFTPEPDMWEEPAVADTVAY